MEELFDYLREIHELLEQINTITDNQTTVLLAPMEVASEEEDSSEGETSQEGTSLDMIAQMADYKDELTERLVEAEDLFQQQYDTCKQLLSDDEDVRQLQGLIVAILERKQTIVEHEQSNLLLLQARSKKQLERVHISQNPKNVADAYKKQQKV